MSSRVFVVGVGMTKFEKPGSRDNFDYPDMARESGQKALQDAGITFDKIEQAFVGYVYGDSTSGQRAVYELGLTGIPIVNVNNNCATGSTALLLAKNAVQGGHANCVLALGFEKMQRGSLSSQYSDRSNPLEKHVEVMSNSHEITGSPMTAQMFGNAGRDYIKKYGLKDDDDVFARIAHKNHKHSVNNPYAQFRTEYSLEDIKNSNLIHHPLTKLQCSPTSDGSAAAVIASEEFVRRHKLKDRAVEILALEMATDLPSTFKENDCVKMVGFDMSQLAAQLAFKKSSLKPQDIQVIELHDCFSANELITYEALGLCAPGKAADLVRNNDNTYGGKYVINPSGGLISKGHPLGATGIAQCAELCWQLRGKAEKRQVPNVRHALSHNIGLGGACVVGIYRLGFASPSSAPTTTTTTTTSSTTPVSNNVASLQSTTSQHKSGQFFDLVESKLKEDGATLVGKVKAIIGFNINCQNNKTISYVIDLKNSSGSVYVNDGNTKPECTVTISDDDLLNILEGKLNMMNAFTQKKLKITGNMSIAMKLNQVFSSIAANRSKLSQQKNDATTATAPAPAQPSSSDNQQQQKAATSSASASSLTNTTTKHKSGKFFEDVEAKLKQDGAVMISKINAIIGFDVACDNNLKLSYVVDLKNAPGRVYLNDGSVKPGCSISINDEDLLNILSGKLNMMNAFTQKKLKISGNMSIAMKLNQLFSNITKSSNSKL